MYRRWQTLQCLGRVLEHEGKIVQSMRYWERAISEGESVATIMPAPDFNSMVVCRMALAKLAERQGDYVRALTILEANLKMWRSMPAKAKTPAFARSLTETWLELSRIHWESSERGADADWARRAVELLNLSRDVEDRVPTQEAEAVYLLQDLLSERASHQRRSDKLEDARRTADQMHAFARLLVSKHPDQSSAHLALSLAFKQFAKDAWQIKDRSAIERTWKLALEEARQALHFDPQDARARREVIALQRRLEDLVGQQEEAVNQGRTVRSPVQH